MWQIAAGILAGFCIGVVASFLGVAGGELLLLLGVVPSEILLPTLAAILVISAIKISRHR